MPAKTFDSETKMCLFVSIFHFVTFSTTYHENYEKTTIRDFRDFLSEYRDQEKSLKIVKFTAKEVGPSEKSIINFMSGFQT